MGAKRLHACVVIFSAMPKASQKLMLEQMWRLVRPERRRAETLLAVRPKSLDGPILPDPDDPLGDAVIPEPRFDDLQPTLSSRRRTRGHGR